MESGKIGGTCGISAQTARHSPLFFYRIEKKEKHENAEHNLKKVTTIRPVQYKNYWSEICSLYLSPDIRGGGLGRLLSLSRFLFIANDMKRFSKMLFAEMRGHIANEASIFWEGIGRHFVDTDFHTLMHLRDEGQIDLTQVLPAHPIYTELLPKEVQESIGKVHDKTQPAMAMLPAEGFVISSEIDICDGGPKIEAELKAIRTVKDSVAATVAEIVNEPIGPTSFIVANTILNFRACLAGIDTLKNGGVVISSDVAEALQLKVGEQLRYVLAAPKESHG